MLGAGSCGLFVDAIRQRDIEVSVLPAGQNRSLCRSGVCSRRLSDNHLRLPILIWYMPTFTVRSPHVRGVTGVSSIQAHIPYRREPGRSVATGWAPRIAHHRHLEVRRRLRCELGIAPPNGPCYSLGLDPSNWVGSKT